MIVWVLNENGKNAWTAGKKIKHSEQIFYEESINAKKEQTQLI